MVDLIAEEPLGGIVPVQIGSWRLEVLPHVPRWSVAPFNGKMADVRTVLKSATGVDWPAPGRVKAKGGMRSLWWGHGQAMLEGADDPRGALAGLAAVTDQSDGWIGFLLTGEDAEAVLARLCEPDLRAATFKRGHVLRTEARHMMIAITRTAKGLEVFVMRSFARTLWDEIASAMESVAARRDIASAI